VRGTARRLQNELQQNRSNPFKPRNAAVSQAAYYPPQTRLQMGTEQPLYQEPQRKCSGAVCATNRERVPQRMFVNNKNDVVT